MARSSRKGQAVGDLRNVAKKEALKEADRDRERRLREGWTIFHFDFDPRLTRRNLSPGDALRHLLKVTHTKIYWWRCPVRGWALQYQKLPNALIPKVSSESRTYVHLGFS